MGDTPQLIAFSFCRREWGWPGRLRSPLAASIHHLRGGRGSRAGQGPAGFILHRSASATPLARPWNSVMPSSWGRRIKAHISFLLLLVFSLCLALGVPGHARAGLAQQDRHCPVCRRGA